MRTRSKKACIFAAVAGLMVSGTVVRAQSQTLIWDSNGATAPLGQDGGGSWDLTSLNWVLGDTTTGTNVAWTNSPVNSAVFGNLTSAAVTISGNYINNNVSIGGSNNDAIVVQDITLGTGLDGSVYNIDDQNGGSLTLNGNINKATAGGILNLTLFNNLTIGAGDHAIALRDTPGDLPELTINNSIQGTGNLVLDNGSQGYESWGTLVLNTGSNFNGSTTVKKGRLVIADSNALSSNSSGAFIGDDGTLSIGGASTTVHGLTINQPITISRSDYGSDADHTHYQYAIIAQNGSGNSTISGPITVNSTDARISVNTSTLTITQPFVEGTGVTAGSSVVSFTGDFAGFVKLTADNSSYPGSYQLLNAVEVQPINQNAIGGPNSKISFIGGATLQPPTDMPTFGTHVINYGSFNGGLDVPPGQTFTLDQAITGGSGLGERGAGTLNINSPITGNGGIFWDGVTIPMGATPGAVGGIINVNAAVSIGSLHLRSSVVNIGTGGSVTTTGGFNSFGADSTGSNGAPDNAVVNLTGTGKFIETTGDNFNISDNANTKGTVNISDNAVFTTGGITWLGKSNGAVGTINQSGGTLTINRNGNFGFVIADGRGNKSPTGFYNLSGGTFTSAGEVYVGEGSNAAHGNWTQTGGTANVNNWFVVGREGALGTVDISGGVLNHNGGNMSLGDSNGGGGTNTINIHGNAVINDIAGEFWVGTGGGDITVMNVSDTAAITVNNWFPVGRFGAMGTLTLSGNTVTTKNGANNAYVGESTTAVTSTITLKDNAIFNDTSGEFWVAQGGGSGILNIQDNASFTVNSWLAVGRQGGSVGVVNLSGGTLTQRNANFFTISSGGTSGTVNVTGGVLNAFQMYIGETGGGVGTLNVSGGAVTLGNTIFANAGTAKGVLNLNGGTLTALHFTAQNGGGTGSSTFNFNGGALLASADDTTFIGKKVTSVVSTGGAKISTNGHNITVNSALTHDTTLAGADGGLTKSGDGVLTMNGNNSFTGITTLKAGAIDLLNNANGNAWTSVLGAGGADVQSGEIAFDYTGTTDPAGTIRTLLVAAKASNFASGQIHSSTVAVDASHLTSLGYGEGADLGLTLAGSALSSAVVVKYTYVGDSSLDGKVDLGNDFNLFLQGYLSGGSTWELGDYNYDGHVDTTDFGMFVDGFKGQGGSLGDLDGMIAASPLLSGAQKAQLLAVVPEPASLGILGIAALACIGRRRRK
jgi:fibronectin-binding autotransporter adhesin